MSESEAEVKKAEKPAPVLPNKPTPEQMVEVEKLLQQASVARIRGKQEIAERALKEASEIAPGSAAVRSALGDELWTRGQRMRARDEYAMAHLLEPTNLHYETKWAEAILGSAGDPLSLSSASYASGKSATLLSLIVPGLGNIALGQTKVGGVMIGLWFLASTWLIATPNGLYSVLRILGLKAGSANINDVAIVPFVIVVLVWLWSVVATVAKAKDQKPVKLERPVPPGQGKIDI